MRLRRMALCFAHASAELHDLAPAVAARFRARHACGRRGQAKWCSGMCRVAARGIWRRPACCAEWPCQVWRSAQFAPWLAVLTCWGCGAADKPRPVVGRDGALPHHDVAHDPLSVGESRPRTAGSRPFRTLWGTATNRCGRRWLAPPARAVCGGHVRGTVLWFLAVVSVCCRSDQGGIAVEVDVGGDDAGSGGGGGAGEGGFVSRLEGFGAGDGDLGAAVAGGSQDVSSASATWSPSAASAARWKVRVQAASGSASSGVEDPDGRGGAAVVVDRLLGDGDGGAVGDRSVGECRQHSPAGGRRTAVSSAATPKTPWESVTASAVSNLQVPSGWSVRVHEVAVPVSRPWRARPLSTAKSRPL